MRSSHIFHFKVKNPSPNELLRGSGSEATQCVRGDIELRLEKLRGFIYMVHSKPFLS